MGMCALYRLIHEETERPLPPMVSGLLDTMRCGPLRESNVKTLLSAPSTLEWRY
jgi:hypothetical protein